MMSVYCVVRTILLISTLSQEAFTKRQRSAVGVPYVSLSPRPTSCTGRSCGALRYHVGHNIARVRITALGRRIKWPDYPEGRGLNSKD